MVAFYVCVVVLCGGGGGGGLGGSMFKLFISDLIMFFS